MPRMPTLPYWRLSSFYFWYYAVIGAFSPYFARWLHELGLSGFAIGSMIALWYGSRIVSPPAWSLLCAGSPKPHRWLHFGAIAAAASFCAFLFVRELWQLLLTMLVFGFFANAILPQFEALTLTRLGTRRDRYGQIRLWGSVGFLVVAVLYGPLLDRLGNLALPVLMIPLLLATAVSALVNRSAVEPPDATITKLGDVLRRPEVRRFLIMVLLMQTAFGPFYVFYTLHLDAHGHSGSVIGLLWGLGVLAEIGLFMLMPRIFARIDGPTVLRICLLASVVRWAVVALLPESLAAMAGAQLIHALSFGAFHAACMQRITEFFPGRLGQHGQGLLYGFSSGVGGVLGALLAGAIWQPFGGLGAFLAAALICLAALALARTDAPPRTGAAPV
jgi:MFS transporter, PPP family, 3-phenylpropionic acid transporter